MPAIDNLFGNGAIHIADQNKKNPVATLCGQALDKDTIRFFEKRENFDQANCKVCRKSYFDEDWSGNKPEKTDESVPEETAQEPGTVSVHFGTLFAGLRTPINVHREIPDGD